MNEKKRNPLAKLRGLFDPYDETTMVDIGDDKVVFNGNKMWSRRRRRA